MYLYSLVVSCPFEPFPQSLYVWNLYGDVHIVVAVVSSTTVVVVRLVVTGTWFVVDVLCDQIFVVFC